MRLSIVIPALNEAANLFVLLPRLRALPGVFQIIVCDGGSRDATVQIAREYGAVVVSSLPNRGLQLNAGARLATGEVLWFLHADARPHPRSAAAICQALENPRVAGGNFRLRFSSRSLAARIFELIARVQRPLGIYYGDSGIWLRREVFEMLGGCRDWPLFEDYDLARRLELLARRRGGCVLCLPLPIFASTRRFARRPLRVLGMWALFQILFWLGVSPHRLARLYHKR